MQLAGVDCGICHEGVAVESDATWCAACGTVLHRACLSSTFNHCPQCRRPYDAPEQHFVYSEVCPECAAPSTGQLASCARCHARTRWDNPAAYQAFRAHMKGVALRSLIRGLAGLGGAGVCVLGIVAQFTGSFDHISVGWLAAGAMVLSADGIIALMNSRTIGKFR